MLNGIFVFICWLLYLGLDSTLIYLLYSCLSATTNFPNLNYWQIVVCVMIFKILSGEIDEYVGLASSLETPEGEDDGNIF